MGFSARFAQSATTADVTGASSIDIPESGAVSARYGVMIRNGRGQLEAPDSDTMYVRFLDAAGAAEDNSTATHLYANGTDAGNDSGANLIADSGNSSFPIGSEWTAQDTMLADGEFEVYLSVDSGMTAGVYTLEMGWIEQGRVSKAQHRIFVGEAETAYDEVKDILADTADMQPKLGTPAGASMSADIAAIDTDVTAILADTAVIGAPAGASISADIAAVDTVVDGIQTDLSNGTDGLGALKTLIDTVDTVADGIQTDLSNGTDGLGALKTLIDTVDTVVDDINSDVGTLANTGGTATLGGMLGDMANSTVAARLTTIDAVVDGIQTDLDNGTDGLGALKTLIDAVQVDVDATNTDLGNATDGLGALKALIDTVDTVVDGIESDVGTLTNTGGTATLGGIFGDMANSDVATRLTTIDTVVDGIQTDLDNGTDGLGALKAAIDSVANASGVQAATVHAYPANATATAILSSDPTENKESNSVGDVTAAAGEYTAIKSYEIMFGEGVTQSIEFQHIFATLKWEMQGAGTVDSGNVKWYLVKGDQSITEATGIAVGTEMEALVTSNDATAITGNQAYTSTASTATLSGLLPDSALNPNNVSVIASNGSELVCYLVAAANRGAGADGDVKVNLYDSTDLEMTYCLCG